MASAIPPHSATESPEPADNRMYVNISIAFLVGIIFLFGMFIFMMILLAHGG